MGCAPSRQTKKVAPEENSLAASPPNGKSQSKRIQHSQLTPKSHSDDSENSSFYSSKPSTKSSNNLTDQSDVSTARRSHYSFKSSFYEENAQGSHNHRVLLKKKHNSSLLPVSSFLSSALLGHIAKNLANGKPIQQEFAIENVKASLLFIDLSGFTNLFQKTASLPNGAETMTQHVNAYFSLLLDTIFKHGGDVEKWAGDAMLVLFYEDNLKLATHRAIQCGMEIQSSQHLREYIVDDVVLTLHCGVASGTFECFHVGGVNNEWKRIIMGSPLADLEQAVSESKRGEVMISAAAHELVAQEVTVLPIVNADAVLVKSILVNVPVKPMKPILLSNQMEAAMRSFLDAYTIEKIDAQQADSSLLSSIKKCTLVFVTLAPKDLQKLNRIAVYQECIHRVQTVIAGYEGSIVNFLADEKGVLIALCFGHPVAHTNDAYRALAASTKIDEFLRQNGHFDYGIGVATGKTFVGTVGGIDRRDFTSISAATNTSARLMKLSQLKEGSSILCDEITMREASSRIEFDALAPVQMKGHDKPMQVFKVLREKESTALMYNQHREKNVSTVRQAHLEKLLTIIKESIPLHASKKNEGWQPPVVLIKKHGSCVGCTRLIRILLGKQDELNVPVIYHVAEDTNQIPFELFGPWARGGMLAFALHNDPTLASAVCDTPGEKLNFSQMRQLLLEVSVEQKKTALLKMFDSFGPQKEFLSLLNSLLEVDFPVSTKLNDLSNEAKKELALRFVQHLLLYRFSQGFTDAFAVVAFDDFHNADAESKESFFYSMVKGNDLAASVLKIVSVDVTVANPALMKRLEEVATVTIDMDTIDATESEAIIREVAIQNNIEALHAEKVLIDFVAEKAGPDVSRAELIVGKLIELDWVMFDDEALTLKVRPRLQNSLHSLDVPSSTLLMIQQRIDRLDANARLVLNIASVIGQYFSFETLQRIFPDVAAYENLRDHLSTIIETGNLVVPSEHKTYDGKPQFAFTNRNVRNIAYAGLLQSLKMEIHGELALYYTQLYNLDRSTQQFTAIENESSALWNELLTSAEHFSNSLCTVESTDYTEDAIALIRLVVDELIVKQLYVKAVELQQQLLLIVSHRQDYDGTKTYLTIQCLVKMMDIVFAGQLWNDNAYNEISQQTLTQGLALSNPNIDLHWDLCTYAWWNCFYHSKHDAALALKEQFRASVKNEIEEFYFHTLYILTLYSMARFKEVEEHTARSTELYALHREGIVASKNKSQFKHDLIVNVLIYGSRAAYSQGKLKTSKRLMYEAYDVQERRNHIFTTRFTLLFNAYGHILRHDYDLLLNAVAKLFKLEEEIQEATGFFYLNMCELYRSYALFHKSTDETEYEALYAKIKKLVTSGNLENQIVHVILFESAFKYLNWLGSQKRCVHVLTEIHDLDEIMHKTIMPSTQEHLKSELLRMYGDLLSFKRLVLSNQEQMQLIYSEEEKIVKYDLKTRKPIIATKEPIGVKLKAGEAVYWCSCGLSQNQPFCDGSHTVHNTGLKPLRYVPERDMEVYFCGCKQTSNPPFCDGTHRELTVEDIVGSVRVSGMDTAEGSCLKTFERMQKEGETNTYKRMPEISDITLWYERALSLAAQQSNLTTTLKVYLSMWNFYNVLGDEQGKSTALHNVVEALAEFDKNELDIDIPFVHETLNLIEEQKRYNRDFLLLAKYGTKKVKLQLKSLSSVQQLKRLVSEKLDLGKTPFDLTFLDEDFGEEVDLTDDVGILPSKAVLNVRIKEEAVKGE